MAHFNFDATDKELVADCDLLPVGEYKAQIVKTEIVPTKDGTGELLRLQWQILDDKNGAQGGRVLFQQLLTKHSSATAVQIAEKMLACICHATRVYRMTDTTQLENIPVIIRVGVHKSKDPQYADNNDIRNAYEYDDVTGWRKATPASGSAAPLAPVVSAPVAKPAWMSEKGKRA